MGSMYDKMKELAYLTAVMGMANTRNLYDEGTPCSRVDYEAPKCSGFTQVKGRKHLSKKKRKQLKTK